MFININCRNQDSSVVYSILQISAVLYYYCSCQVLGKVKLVTFRLFDLVFITYNRTFTKAYISFEVIAHLLHFGYSLVFTEHP